MSVFLLMLASFRNGENVHMNLISLLWRFPQRFANIDFEFSRAIPPNCLSKLLIYASLQQNNNKSTHITHIECADKLVSAKLTSNFTAITPLVDTLADRIRYVFSLYVQWQQWVLLVVCETTVIRNYKGKFLKFLSVFYFFIPRVF